MSTTTNLSLPFLEAGQAQKHVTLNEALRLLDAVVQLAVNAVSANPPAAPVDGERHIVGVEANGVFAGHDNKIAAFQDGAWLFLAPSVGWRAWNAGEGALLVWTGIAWTAVFAGGDVTGPASGVTDGDVAVFDGASGKAIKRDRGSITSLGVGSAPDAPDTDHSNRLIVRANRALFHSIPAGETPGTGDMQVQLSKETAGNTASFFFSTNFSGRAEFGLVGSDEFALKVSANGGAWMQALVADPASGRVRLPQNDVAEIVLLPNQAAYDALNPPDAKTLYLIAEGS
jgi:hypothetical protein